MDGKYSNGRLIIVSNRLPVVIEDHEGVLKTTAGSGGLITALVPVLKNRGGLWIGWPGHVDKKDEQKAEALLKKGAVSVGYHLQPVFLSPEEIKLYYEGFSNEVIWPLFHDLQSECHFHPGFWTAAQEVTQKFAEKITQNIKSKDFVWVHDYHLILVGLELRKAGVQQRIGYFLHIPFPPLDIFLTLPWRFQILKALLEYDLVGFQTMRDLRNFMQCVKRLLPEVKTTAKYQSHLCQTKDREVRVGAFPISIDYHEFSKTAEGGEVVEQMWSNYQLMKGQKIVFSCDRLDISKGIPYRLEAIRYLLKHHPEIHGKVTFFQVVIPSRTEIPKYQELKKEIDRLVGEINSEFSQTGWIPIHYLYNSISRKELLAFYRFAEIALITPVKDGMNLVAKEYVASNSDENGVLILSEFAGSAFQLQHEAVLINPYDIEGMAESIYRALTMPLQERKRRMRKMRRSIQRNDVFVWVQTFLKVAFAKELVDFPIIEEYMPTDPDDK